MEEKPEDLAWRGFRGFRNTNRSVSQKRKMEKEKEKTRNTALQLSSGLQEGPAQDQRRQRA